LSWDPPPSWTDKTLQDFVDKELAKLDEKDVRTATFKLLGGKFLHCKIVKLNDDTHTFWSDDEAYDENDSRAMKEIIVNKFHGKEFCSGCLSKIFHDVDENCIIVPCGSACLTNEKEQGRR